MSQNRDAPAYQEYAATILAQLSFRTMTLQERGLLYTMRLECWVNMRLPQNTPKVPAVDMADYRIITEKIGNLEAICPDCDKIMNRRVSLAKPEHVRGKMEITMPQALQHIKRAENGPDMVMHQLVWELLPNLYGVFADDVRCTSVHHENLDLGPETHE